MHTQPTHVSCKNDEYFVLKLPSHRLHYRGNDLPIEAPPPVWDEVVSLVNEEHPPLNREAKVCDNGGVDAWFDAQCSLDSIV